MAFIISNAIRKLLARALYCEYPHGPFHGFSMSTIAPAQSIMHELFETMILASNLTVARVGFADFSRVCFDMQKCLFELNVQ